MEEQLPEQQEPQRVPERRDVFKIEPYIREPRIGDRVLVDVEWTETSGKEPNPTVKGRIMGETMDAKFYISLSPMGNMVYFDKRAVKIDY